MTWGSKDVVNFGRELLVADFGASSQQLGPRCAGAKDKPQANILRSTRSLELSLFHVVGAKGQRTLPMVAGFPACWLGLAARYSTLRYGPGQERFEDPRTHRFWSFLVFKACSHLLGFQS